MGIFSWGGRREQADPQASQRWTQAVGDVDQRYRALADMPFEEAVDVAWHMTPGGLTRDEVAERMRAARRSGDDGTTTPPG